MSSITGISQFYEGKSIFITGATGFLGKVLIEKLLRTCPGIKNIYILIRNKKGLTPTERINEAVTSQIFDKIKEKDCKAIEKIIPISGDLQFNDIGISKNDLNEMIENVSIVIHCGATVNFNNRLKDAVQINTVSVQKLIHILKKFNTIEAFVHVSTAYINCNKKEIHECVYPPLCDPYCIIEMMNNLPEDIVEKITPILINGHPNTYNFTKSLTEQIVINECNNNIPTAIVRPSIVGASLNEPLPGWIDNYQGITSSIIELNYGLYRTEIFPSLLKMDLIPVDLVINLIISVAWHTSLTKSKTVKVYNCVSSAQNPLTWIEFMKKMVQNGINYPFENVFMYPNITAISNVYLLTIYRWIEQEIPAYVADFLARMRNQKPRMVKLQTRMNAKLEKLTYFFTNEWQFLDTNVVHLWNSMSDSDRNTFQFDVQSINWNDYLKNYCCGIRKYLLKQDSSSLPKCRQNMRRLFHVYIALKVLLFGLILAIFVYFFNII